jgi:hypothetical protein
LVPTGSGTLQGPSQPALAAATPKYLGENREHILILVHDPGAVYLEEKSFQFLLTILDACKLSMSAVALVNTAQNSATPESLAETLGSRVILGFGMNTSAYEVQTIGGKTWLGGDALSLIEADRNLKGRLWSCLKQVCQR